MSIEQLKPITTQIGKAIAENVDKDNPDEVSGKIQELTTLLASSSHAVALSEMVYNEKIGALIEDAAFGGLTSTDKKMIFAGRAKTEIYYITLCERQNKALVHKIEGLRSILSYLKEEVRNLNN